MKTGYVRTSTVWLTIGQMLLLGASWTLMHWAMSWPIWNWKAGVDILGSAFCMSVLFACNDALYRNRLRDLGYNGRLP